MYTFPKVYSYTDGSGSGSGSGSVSFPCDPPCNAAAGCVDCLPPEACDPPPAEGSCSRCENTADPDGDIGSTMPVVKEYPMVFCEPTLWVVPESHPDAIENENGVFESLFPVGASSNTHTIDFSVTACQLDGPVPCPMIPRAPEDVLPEIVDPPANTVTNHTINSPMIIKKGLGTAVIRSNGTTINTLNIYSGTVILDINHNNNIINQNTIITLLHESSSLRFSDETIAYASRMAFPPQGKVGNTYLAVDTNTAYIWDPNPQGVPS